MCTALWEHQTHGQLRCGQCMECRLAYSREWAIRITHEASMHDQNSFLTLTYDDAHLPAHGQLVKADLQKFFKRMRHFKDFRYVACGEYGERKRRPHFHVALFGVDFREDRIEFGQGVQGDKMYISKSLSRFWNQSDFPRGHTIGSLTFESAAYIARYITKKISGVNASKLPLALVDDELIMPNDEFLICSKGIGKSWYEKFFLSDVFPHGRVITAQGTPAPIPRYYKTRLASQNAMMSMKLRGVMYSNDVIPTEKKFYESSNSRKTQRANVVLGKSKLFKRDVKD